MYKHLTPHELYYIWLNRVNKLVLKQVPEIAKDLGRHRSTIYRAIKFIKSTKWGPSILQSSEYKRNCKKFKKISPKVLLYITNKLKIGCSPEIISGRMRKEIKHYVSYKTIYSYILADKQSGGVLYKYLPIVASVINMEILLEE